MSTGDSGIGPAGKTVSKNVARLRKASGTSLAELSRQLGEVGRPMQVTSLRRLEAGERRVDVDDLVALAEVFGLAHPARLLENLDMPRGDLTDALGGKSLEDVKEEIRAELIPEVVRAVVEKLNEGSRGQG